MNLGDVKDIVREHFSRTAFPTVMLDFALAEGRRIVESHANFWWMRDEKDFSLTIGTGSYGITTSGTGNLNLPNFKDARAFHWAQPSGVRFEPTELGTITKEEADLLYDSDDEGNPELVLVENDDLIIYPANPDKAYDCRFYIFNWTDNPADNLSTDALISHFPMALAYAALVWGYEQQLKDFNGASYWRVLLQGPPGRLGGEIAKLKRANFKRDTQEKISLVPLLGSTIRANRRLDNMQIYR